MGPGRTLFALSVVVATPAFGQQPNLTGSVRIDPREGLLAGALCLNGFEPRIRPRFLLNTALNIKSITDSAGAALPYEGEYNGRILGEAREYVIAPRDTLSRTSRFCVDYRGAVPVFDTNSATEDWKGRITAMRGTIRASEQTRWYPVLFDSASGRMDGEVTFDITVECGSCASMYMNGTAPQAGTSAHFVSTTPRPPMLFAGAFTFTTTPDLAFVAGSAGQDASRAFSTAIRDIASYYARLLQTPYNERPTLLTFQSISRDRRPGVADWQFVTWPTIAMAGGISFDSALVMERGVPVVPRQLWTTLSHEMAHYYFGTTLRPIGPLRWFALESMAEYLSLKAVAALRGPVAGAARLIDVVQGMGAVTLPSLDRIKREGEITGTYRYQYAPAFLMAMEARHGEEKMVAWMREIISISSSTVIDFEVVARAAERAGLARTALTSAWDVESIRLAHIASARRALATAADNPATAAEAVTIVAALVNIDTTAASRLHLLTQLRGIARRDSSRLDVLYQMGRIGALTGRELDVARAALERYVRFPATAGAPSHAAAFWRMGMIEEHGNRIDQARIAYQRALDVDPGYTAARDALTRLGRPPSDRHGPVPRRTPKAVRSAGA